jgi:CRISPR-associated protein Csm2
MAKELVKGLQIEGKAKTLTDADIQKLIGSDSKLLVQVADAFGKRIARNLSTSHIRNIYGAVKEMEMSGFNYHAFVLLKPKIAYAAKRDGSDSATELKDVLSEAIDAVTNDEHRFHRFADFFEAILAYHKAYGGK